jgi:hypothetical protein
MVLSLWTVHNITTIYPMMNPNKIEKSMKKRASLGGSFFCGLTRENMSKLVRKMHRSCSICLNN